MLVHAIRGRVRLRIAELRADETAGERIAALLLMQPGVISVRVIAACASLVVIFEASVISQDELAALLDQHCGADAARPAQLVGDERFSLFSLGYALIDPFGEIRELLTLVHICSQALRDLSRRPHPSVFFHAALRLLIECALFDSLLPPLLRILLRIARGLNTIRSALRRPAVSY